MPTVIHTPIKNNKESFNKPALKPHESDIQLDRIDYDLLLLDHTVNPPKNLLIEIRRDIDDYTERLSKLQKRLAEVVEVYDKHHKMNR